MSMQRNNNLRTIISYALGFIIALSFGSFLCMAQIRISACTESTFTRNLKSSGYKGKAYDEFCVQADEVFSGQGIKIVYQNLFPKDQAMLDYLKYEKAALNGHKESINRDEIVEKIQGAVEPAMTNALQEELIKPDEAAVKENIDYYSNQIADLYMKYMQPEFLYEMKTNTNHLKTVVNIGMIVSLVFMIGATTLLYFLYKHKERADKFVLAGLFGAAGFDLLATILVYIKMNVNGMGIASGAFKEFVGGYVTDVKISFFVGTTLAFLTVGLFIYFRMMEQSMWKKRRK